MTDPWIEIEEYQDRDFPTGSRSDEYTWQALFACLVEILPHPDWAKLKWGFNASALFDESLERQRLFLESRYSIQNEGIESPDRCTLSFRFIHRPGEGLLVAVIVKLQERTPADAKESAKRYFSELRSTFPYDYTLTPACSREDLFRLSGMDILEEKNDRIRVAQIKRMGLPLSLDGHPSFLQGLWRSGPRTHEQIWRALAATSFPVLLDISLRSTFLYERERERLLNHMEEISGDQKTLSSLKIWHRDYVERLLTPWKKFFYLQVHVVSPPILGEHLGRIIGTALTLTGDGPARPGYHVVWPTVDEGRSWQRKLRNLDLIFTGSPHAVPRLSEVADLEEVFAVMRLPYSPPENGFPDMKFLSAGNR
jgi:hypothetical protein